MALIFVTRLLYLHMNLAQKQRRLNVGSKAFSPTSEKNLKPSECVCALLTYAVYKELLLVIDVKLL